MISTVTTSTISTITTAALTGSVALIAILVLLALLIQKELTVTSENSRLQRVGRAINIGLAPLLIVFFVLVVVKVMEVVQ
jgi:hypothetical protein